MISAKVGSAKVGLVTGASSGLGKELAQLLARMNFRLSLCGRDAERLENSAKSCETEYYRPWTLSCDLSQLNDCESFAKGSFQNWGPADLLINNAGLGHFGEFHQMGPSQIESMIDVNLKAVMLLTHFVMAQQRENPLCIVNISSAITRFKHHPQKVAYAVSKFGLNAFSQALATETSPDKVRILNVILGPTKTDFDRSVPAPERLRILRNAGIERTLETLEAKPLDETERVQFFEKLGDWYLDPRVVAQTIVQRISEYLDGKELRGEIEIRPLKA